jgi:T-complex protein 1 subunit gamma
MKELGVWESFGVKSQSLKAAIETAVMLLRIDKVVSGVKRQQAASGGAVQQPQEEENQGEGPM